MPYFAEFPSTASTRRLDASTTSKIGLELQFKVKLRLPGISCTCEATESRCLAYVSLQTSKGMPIEKIAKVDRE
jgi:hypothetical protein